MLTGRVYTLPFAPNTHAQVAVWVLFLAPEINLHQSQKLCLKIVMIPFAYDLVVSMKLFHLSQCTCRFLRRKAWRPSREPRAESGTSCPRFPSSEIVPIPLPSLVRAGDVLAVQVIHGHCHARFPRMIRIEFYPGSGTLPRAPLYSEKAKRREMAHLRHFLQNHPSLR